MATLDKLQPYVTVNVTLQASEVLPSSLGMLIPLAHSYWTDRVRSFSTASATDLLAELVSLGVDEGEPLYHRFYEIVQQPRRPSTIYVGRREPGDATWAIALDAMRAASDEWVYLSPMARDQLELREFADWQILQLSGAGIYGTDDANVYAETPANLAEYLVGLSAPAASLLWHDATTASAASAPYVDTSVGPWSLTPGGVLSSIADAGTPETYTLAAAQAIVTGTNAGPFAGSDGQVLTGSVDGVAFTATLDATEASITATIAETYNMTGVGNIVVESDTGSVTYAFGSGAAPALLTAVTAVEVRDDFLAAVAGTTALATAAGGLPTFRSATQGTAGRFRFGAGTDATFLSNLGLVAGVWYTGSGNVANVAAYTAAEIGALVQSDIGTAGTAGDDGAAALEIASDIYGTDAEVVIGAGSTAGLLTAIGLTAATTNGTGDVANAASVSAVELEPLLDAAYADVSVTLIASNTAIRLESTLGVGRWHTLRYAGELRSELGITGALVRGAGVEDDHADACALAQLLGVDLDAPPPTGGLLPLQNLAITGSAVGDTIPRPKSLSLRQTANVNTLEQLRSARKGPEIHDGRVCWLLDGTPVYFETLIARDWLAIRLQEAIKAGLDAASDNNRPVGYTTAEVRAAVLDWIQPVLETAVQTRKISAADLTPPNPSEGKVTGVTITALEDLTAAQRTLRITEINIAQRVAASLGGAVVNLTIINA